MVVQTKTYTQIAVNESEILRYAGVKTSTKEINDLIKECLAELKNHLIYKVCYLETPIVTSETSVDFGFNKTQSKSLAKNLNNCSSCIIFCATLGIGIDRLIAKYNAVSPTKALIFQAIGAERIESLCNLFCKEIKEGKCVRPRFSPGYGDFSLDFQREIFKVLDCSKKIGVTLNESLLISPTKSVTAIVGISKTKEAVIENDCNNCNLKDCEFRK